MKDKVDSLKYSEMLELQKTLNAKLQKSYAQKKGEGREYLSSYLVNFVSDMVNELNESGYKFGRCDYSGDINFENSEQTYSDGAEMGHGVILHFHGFSVQVSWEGFDKYA